MCNLSRSLDSACLPKANNHSFYISSGSPEAYSKGAPWSHGLAEGSHWVRKPHAQVKWKEASQWTKTRCKGDNQSHECENPEERGSGRE